MIEKNCCYCHKKINYNYNNDKFAYLNNIGFICNQVNYICRKCFGVSIYYDVFSLPKPIDNDVNNIELDIYLCGKMYLTQSNIKQIDRKIKIIKIIKDMKLELSEDTEALCNAYIKFGKPSLDGVISIIRELQMKKNNRLYKLLKYLEKNGIEYNVEIPSFNKYLKYGSSIITLDEVLVNSKWELFLINNTNYLKYLKIYDEKEACDMAVTQYLDKGGSSNLVSEYIEQKTCIRFE